MGAPGFRASGRSVVRRGTTCLAQTFEFDDGPGHLEPLLRRIGQDQAIEAQILELLGAVALLAEQEDAGMRLFRIAGHKGPTTFDPGHETFPDQEIQRPVDGGPLDSALAKRLQQSLQFVRGQGAPRLDQQVQDLATHGSQPKPASPANVFGRSEQIGSAKIGGRWQRKLLPE
jgi:hypothetical protein